MAPVNKNLKALRGALEHSVSIQTVRLQEIVDGLVARGSLTRAEADQFLGQLVASSKGYTAALLQVLDSVAGPVVTPVVSTAGKVVGAARQVPKLVPGARTKSRKTVVATKPVPVVAPVADAGAVADGAAAFADGPIAGYDALTVGDIKPRLAGLGRDDLVAVRDRETAGKARKGVLAEIERLLDTGA